MRGIDDVLACRPLGEFGARALPAFDAVERDGEVGSVLGMRVKRDIAHLLCAVGGDEASCLLVDIHAAIIRG